MVTMLILPFMSCSARYPVYILLISAFFTAYQGTILFAIYLFGIFLSGIVAWILKKSLFKKETIPFVMELPPYRVPVVKSVLKQTWFKGKQYLHKMGSVILIASIIIWALGYFPVGKDIDARIDDEIAQVKAGYLSKSTPGKPEKVSETMINELNTLELQRQKMKQENSFIGRLGKFIEPVIKPLGYDWKMGVSLIAGGAAKEIVISTMGVLYQTGSGDDSNKSLIHKLREQKYDDGPGKGRAVFTPLVALSFMLFILIYFPCIAVIAAIKNESGQWKWSAFLAVYTTILAWVVAFVTYQGGSMLGF